MRRLSWIRTTADSGATIGAPVQMGLVVLGCGLVVGLIFAAGWDRPRPDEPAGAPPAWVGSAVWIGLFAAMGLARWLLTREMGKGWLRDGRRGPQAFAARLRLDLLMANCLLYPFYTLGFSVPALGLAGNLATILLAIWAGVAAWRADRLAGLLVMLPVPWVTYATLLVVRQLGWA